MNLVGRNEIRIWWKSLFLELITLKVMKKKPRKPNIPNLGLLEVCPDVNFRGPGISRGVCKLAGRYVRGSVTVKSPGIILVWSRPFPVYHDFIYLWSSWEASGDRIGIPPKILMGSTAEGLCASKGILASWGVLLCSCGSFPEMPSLPIASRRQFFCRLRPCLFLILKVLSFSLNFICSQIRLVTGCPPEL